MGGMDVSTTVVADAVRLSRIAPALPQSRRHVDAAVSTLRASDPSPRVSPRRLTLSSIFSVDAVQGIASRAVNVEGGSRVELETQTHAVGTIVPPPDIRAIVDKTAQFVAKNGPEFEQRILGSEKNNQKFNFLLPADPYNAYYRGKIAAFKEEAAGGDAAAVQAKADEATKAANEATGTVTVAATGAAAPKIIAAPRKAEYSVDVPPGIASLDLDVIKLTAQFAARNGKGFLSGLASREHANPQFNFLKPTHSMFGFFTSLADAYSRVLKPPPELDARLRKDEDKSGLLERALQRLEWERSQDAAKAKADDEAEKEREAMALIDWHDFQVVETIDFLDEEDDELPAPLALRDVIAQLRDAEMTHGGESAGAGEGDAAAADEDAEMDEEEQAMIQEAEAVGEPIAAETAPAAPGPEPSMKIVRNHKKPEVLAAEAKAKAAHGADATKFAVSPITGELIAVNDMAEHMRISLIDPKWKTQKEAMLAKLKGSTMASDEEIAANVLSLARTRPDIFGTTDEEVKDAVVASMESKNAGRTAPAGAAQAPVAAAPPLRAGMARAPVPPPPPPAMPAAPIMPPPPAPAVVPAVVPAPPPAPPVIAPPLAPGPALKAAPVGLAPPPFAGGVPAMPPPPFAAATAAAPEPEPEEDAGSKKRKVGEIELEEEATFLAANPGGGVVKVQCPSVDGDDTLNGQVLELAVDSLDLQLSEFKALIKDATGGLAANKQKLSAPGLGFLTDKKTFAYYNIAAGSTLQLALKERGGRKK